MKTKTPLRDALSAIAPNKPLVFLKEQAFQAPQKAPTLPSNTADSLPKPTDSSREGIVGSPTQGEINPTGQTCPSDQKEPQDQESPYPEDENGALPTDQNGTQEQDIPQDEKGTNPGKPRLTRDEITALALSKLRKGFTQIPNSVLMDIINGDLSKAEIKILLLISRFTLSFAQRETAPLSKADIERYTKLQGKCILQSLTSLEDKKKIIKIKGDQYTPNRLGLRCETTPNSSPPDSTSDHPGEGTLSKMGGQESGQNPSSDQNGTHPEDTNGTLPVDEKSPCPTDQKSTHFKESSSKSSFKESLSYKNSFPADLTTRWKHFQQSGHLDLVKQERRLFLKEYTSLKKDDPTLANQFFENCGKVVAFLEEYGNGKDNQEGKVHHPMAWIQGHWAINFANYRKRSDDQRLEQEALEKQKVEKDRKEAEEKREAEERQQRQAKMDADIERFLSIHRTESAVNAFVENAVQLANCDFTRSSWKAQGWNSPLVRACAISHFLKTEAESHRVEVEARNSEASA